MKNGYKVKIKSWREMELEYNCSTEIDGTIFIDIGQGPAFTSIMERDLPKDRVIELEYDSTIGNPNSLGLFGGFTYIDEMVEYYITNPEPKIKCEAGMTIRALGNIYVFVNIGSGLMLINMNNFNRLTETVYPYETPLNEVKELWEIS